MPIFPFVAVIVLVAFAFLTWKRVLAWVVMSLARRKHLQLTVDAFTLTAASGISLRLEKGAVRQVVVRHVRLGWDANGQGAGRLWSLLSGSPCIRLHLSGVRVTVAGPAASAPQANAPRIETSNGRKPRAAAAGVDSAGAQYRPSLGLLQLLSISVEDVAIDVESGGELASLKGGSAVLANSTQQLQLSGLVIAPAAADSAGVKAGQALCLVQGCKLHHDGPLVALQGKLASPLHSISVELGDITVDLSPAFWLSGQALLQQLGKPRGGAVATASSVGEKQLHLDGTLAKLPREFVLQMSSLEVVASTEAGLQLAFRLAEGSVRSLRAADGEAREDSGYAAPVLSVACSWQRLACSVQADDLQEPCVDLQCSSSEISLHAARTASCAAEQLSVCGEVAINAMHTRVWHGSLGPLLQYQPAPIPPKSQAAGHRRSLLSDWRVTVGLGQGSSLQFLDADSECLWLSSLAAAKLIAAQLSSGGEALHLQRQRPPPRLSLQFSAAEIEMVTAQGKPGTAQSPRATDQLLAAKSVQLALEPADSRQGLPQQHPHPPLQQEAPYKGDLSSASVRVLLQPSSVAAIAAVAEALAPVLRRPKRRPTAPQAAPAATKQRTQSVALSFAFADTLLVAPATVTVPAEHSSTTRLQLVYGTLGAALANVAGSVQLGGGRAGSVTGVQCSLVYCEGLAAQRFPTDAAALLAQAKSTVLSLRRAVLSQESSSGAAIFADGAVGSQTEGWRRLEVQGVAAVADVDALGCALQTLDDVLVMHALLRSSAQPHPQTSSSRSDDAAARGLAGQGTSSSELDATNIVSLNAQQADGDAESVDDAAAAAASPGGHSRSHSSGRPLLFVDLHDAKLSVPLSADLVASLEVDAAHAELAAARGVHEIHTQAVTLSLKGKSIMRWSELAATLQTPLPGCPPVLEPQPIHPMDHSGLSKLAKSSSLVANWAIATSAGHALLPLSGKPSALPPPRHQAAKTGGSALASGYLPYSRARLQPWLNEAAESVHAAAQSTPPLLPAMPSTGAQTAAPTATSPGDEAYLGTGPGSVLDLTVTGFELCVPYDREPGPAQRYAEMYSEAVRSAFVDRLTVLRKRTRGEAAGEPQPRAGGTSAARGHGLAAAKATPSLLLPLPLQLNLTVRGLAIRFEHHPLESWLAMHGALLRRVAVQQDLWEEAASTVRPSDVATSPLHAGMMESAFSAGSEAEGEQDAAAAASAVGGDQAWEGLMAGLAQLYKAEVKKAVAEAAASGGRGRDLFCVQADALQALVVVCGSSGAAGDAALAHIVAVDPPSAGVQLERARKLHTDAVLHALEVLVGSATQPLVSAARLSIGGTLAVARQATAPPAQAQRLLAVGAHRAVPVPVNVRGCRAPFKVYTDVSTDFRRLAACFSPGMDPFLAQIGLAGKRLAPSDPDKTAPRPPPVPWFDDIRYFWRGKAALRAAPLCITLAAHTLPTVDATSQRMQIAAAVAEGQTLAGDTTFSLRGLSCTLFRAAGMEQPGGTLLVLPFIHSPASQFRLRMAWKLPKGRAADDHHLFPAKVGPGTQQPVVVAHEFKSEGVDLAIDVALGETATLQSFTGLPIPAADGGTGGAAVGFIGDHQIAFMRTFIHALKVTPPHIRACARRGTFFARKPRGGPPKRGIPKLLQLLRVSVATAPLELVHFTVDAADPSGGLCLAASSASFGAAWLLNQPMPSFLRPPPHAKAKGLLGAAPTRAIAQDFSLSFAGVRMSRDDGGGGDGGIQSDKLQQRQPPSDADGASTSAAAAAVDELWPSGPLTLPGQEPARPSSQGSDLGRAASLLRKLVTDAPVEAADSGRLLTAALVTASRAPAGRQGAGGGGPDDPEDAFEDVLEDRQAGRPVRVKVQECKLLVDLATRNAVWAAVTHLVSAFSPQPTPGAVRHAGSTLSGGKRSPSPFSQLLSPGASASRRDAAAELARRVSTRTAALRSPSAGSEGEQNELLSLLLQQREAAGGGDALSDVPTPHGTTAGDEVGPGSEADDGDEEDGEGPMSSPLDDMHSVLRYEVEVANLQAMLLPADGGQGRLLLAAKGGRLRGLALPDGPAPLRITTLGLEAVQAFVSLTDVDPHASLSWLEATAEGFSAPAGDGPAALRRIFNPIRVDLRHSKMPSLAVTCRPPSARPASTPPLVMRTPTPGGIQGALKGEELVLKIPEVAAVMVGREFEVLADVLSLLLTPGPRVETVAGEGRLLIECESEEVEDARALFALVRQQLACLRGEALELRRCLGLQLRRAGAPALPGGEPRRAGAELHAFAAATGRAANANGGDAGDDVGGSLDLLPVLTAMREHIAGEAMAAAALAAASAVAAGGGGDSRGSSPGPSTPGPHPHRSPRGSSAHLAVEQRRLSRDPQRDHQVLLLRWVEEQESAARATYGRTRAALLAHKAAASKQAQSRSATRVLLQLDRVVWQLCTPERHPFVQAALRGVSFDRYRNRDHSGSAKFIIHRVDIVDATGALPEGPATAAGVILSAWNPDASYEREPVLRVITTMGVPTPTHAVFEHLDATLHPLSIHLTEGIAVAAWEYFFPKEDARTRQEAFSQSVAGGGRRYRAAGSSGGAADGAPTAESPAVGASPRTSRSAANLSDLPSYAGTPPGASPSRPPGHKSATSADFAAIAGASPFPLAREAPPVAAASAASSTATTPTAATRPAFRPGAAVPLAGSAALGSPAGGAAVLHAAGEGGGAAAAAGRPRKRFVYVKLNRAHLRITYQGYPIGIRDRILVVNSYTCENLDGRWRDLLANVKQKAILSAVWSGLGLQGRKIKELLDGAAPAAPAAPRAAADDDDGRGGAKGLLAKMGLGGKARREAASEAELTEEEVRALQKKRALFGDHMAKSMARRGFESASTSGAAAAASPPWKARAAGGDGGGGGQAGSPPPGPGHIAPDGASRRQATHLPPKLWGLQLPLPPEEPPDVGGTGRSSTRGSARSSGDSALSSPLRAGLAAAVGKARGGGGEAAPPAAALLGQAYHQMQTQQEATTAQLLGTGPRPQGGAPKRWVQNLATRARDTVNRLKDEQR